MLRHCTLPGPEDAMRPRSCPVAHKNGGRMDYAMNEEATTLIECRSQKAQYVGVRPTPFLSRKP